MNKQAAEEKAAPVNPMSMFETSERAMKPYRVFLEDPATGRTTEHYVDVLSSLSNVFLQTRDRLMQEATQLALVPKAERDALRARNKLKLHASLLHAWSFPQDCNEENKIAFLEKAPQISEMLVRVADEGSYFFKEPSTD